MDGNQKIRHCELLGRSCFEGMTAYIHGSDEHYRRSPGCPFFIFAGSTAPKAGRGKKARASKASRLSTQSNVTTASQVPSIPDLNDSIDVSNISQDTVLSTASTMASKKGGKGKGRFTRAKNTDPIEVVEANGHVAGEVVVELPAPAHRGTKRRSEDISEDHRGGRESTVKPEPQPKRRATRSRNSETQEIGYPVLDALEITHEKPTRGGRKRASSRCRKVTTASAANTASLRATLPDDAEIEAALEADLDKAMPDQPALESEAIEELPKPKTRGRVKKTVASAAPARSTRQATAESEASQQQPVGPEEPPLVSNVETKEKPASKGKGRKAKVTKKTVNERTAPSGRASNESIINLGTNAESQLSSSLLTTHTTADDSGHETDASVTSQMSVTRKGSKKKGNARAKGKKTGLASKNIEDIVQTKAGSQPATELSAIARPDLSLSNVEQNLADHHDVEETIEAEQPKRVTRATRGGKAKAKPTAKAKTKFPQLSMPGMFSPLMGDMDRSFNSVLAASSPPVAPVQRPGLGADHRIPVTLAQASSPNIPQPTKGRASPPTVARSTPVEMQSSTPQRNKNTNEATPSPSPQSSDAENQPPSSRPPSVRPPLAILSPSKGLLQRIPLAPGTPRQVPLSPSKIGGLRSEMPWTAVDVEMIFAASPDKENRNIFDPIQKQVLTSPEKAMTVEEWIKSQAGGTEEKLKAEAERIVGIFETEGGRALGVLEAIDVVE